jgi:hypothetical protein
MIRSVLKVVTSKTNGRRSFLGLAAVVAVLVSGFSGCGDPNAAKTQTLNPVKGKVLLADGSPLKSGQVALVSTTAGTEYSGTINSDGSFEVKTAYGDGAPEGTYKVRIDAEATPAGSGKGKTASRKASANLPFPAKYSDEATSDLTVTVKSGENNLEPFKLVAGASQATSKAGRNLDQKD